MGIQRVNIDKFRALRSNDLDPKAATESGGSSWARARRHLELKLLKSQNHGLMLVSLFVLGLILDPLWQGSYEILCRIIFQ